LAPGAEGGGGVEEAEAGELGGGVGGVGLLLAEAEFDAFGAVGAGDAAGDDAYGVVVGFLRGDD